MTTKASIAVTAAKATVAVAMIWIAASVANADAAIFAIPPEIAVNTLGDFNFNCGCRSTYLNDRLFSYFGL